MTTGVSDPIYLGEIISIIENPSVWLGMGVFASGAVIMATFSMRQMNNDNFGKIEEWNFDDVIQDAEMVDEIPKKKTRKKKPKK